MYRFKLSVMMFLEFFIWGAWLPLIFGYLPSLGFDALQQGLILGAFNLAAFTAMFFSTQFADRMFSAEKYLAREGQEREQATAAVPATATTST